MSCSGERGGSTTHSSAGLFLFSAVFICLCAPVRLFYSPCSSQHMDLFEQLSEKNPDLRTHKCTFIATEISIVYPFVRVENINLSSFHLHTFVCPAPRSNHNHQNEKPNPNHNPNLNVNPILTFSLKPRLNPQTAQKSSQRVHTVPFLPIKCKHCSLVSGEHKK